MCVPWNFLSLECVKLYVFVCILVPICHQIWSQSWAADSENDRWPTGMLYSLLCIPLSIKCSLENIELDEQFSRINGHPGSYVTSIHDWIWIVKGILDERRNRRQNRPTKICCVSCKNRPILSADKIAWFCRPR